MVLVGVRVLLGRVLAGVRVLLRRILAGVWVLLRWVLTVALVLRWVVACIWVRGGSCHGSRCRGGCCCRSGSGLLLVVGVVSCDELSVLVSLWIAMFIHLPNWCMSRAPPARPAAAPPAPYIHLLPPPSFFSFFSPSTARAASEPAGGGLFPAAP